MKSVFLSLALSFHLCVTLQAQSVDLRILESINGPRSGADKYWKVFSDASFYINASVPVAIYASGRLGKDKDLMIKSYETAGALFITGASTFVLKHAIKRPRPFDTYPDLIYKKGDGGGYSFPSGHTSMSFATATSLSLAFKKWYVVVPAFTYATAVGYSRMYLGVHYPGDVLAGALVGCGSAYLSFTLQKWLAEKESRKRH